MKTETGDIQQACHNVLYLSKWIPRWLSGNLSAKMQEMQVQSLVGKIPRGGNGNPLQYPHWENPTVRGAWWAIECGVTKSQI